MDSSKKNKKYLIIAIIVIVIICLIALIVHCVGGKTVESYAKNNTEITKELSHAFGSSSKDITYEKNTITIKNRMAASMSPEDVVSLKKILKEDKKELSEGIKPIINKIEKKTDIEDVSIKVIYLDGKNKEIATKVYK